MSQSPRSSAGISICQSFWTKVARTLRRRASAAAISTSNPTRPVPSFGSWKTYGSPPWRSPHHRSSPAAWIRENAPGAAVATEALIVIAITALMSRSRVRRVYPLTLPPARRGRRPIAAVLCDRSMRALSIAIIMCVLAAPARGGDAVGAFAPYEDLLEVLAPLAWHLNDDLYRFPPPRDPTGHDLLLLSLARLEGWEKRFPSSFRDVTTFGRAETLERLGEYEKATDAYRQVAGMPESPL